MEAATSQLTEVIRVFLESLNITPLSYASLFSTNIDVNDIQKLADEGVFPVLTGLAPAFTYAIVLSLARYVLQIILFKPLAMKLMRVRDVPVTINARIDQRFANAANKSPKVCVYSSGVNCTDLLHYRSGPIDQGGSTVLF